MKCIAMVFSLLCLMMSGCSNGPSQVEIITPPAPLFAIQIPVPTRSLAVSRYSGTEKRPVTLAPEVRITKKQLMKGVGKNTLLIVIHNKSGHLLSGATQLVLWDYNRGGYYGRGPLFPGEMRIIKAHDIAPAQVLLVWRRRGVVKRGASQSIEYTGGKWRSEHSVQSGPPLVLTILPEDKIRVTRSINDAINHRRR